ncbi:MAG TPA: DEAD/DEAH box helicase [Fimbriimonadaceae bacterium]|jgi:ATP-dependent RNA helicase RhlE
MQISEVQGFEALSVAPALCSRLEKLGITVPTPIQAGAIPVALEGKDLVGIAQTGTGKTLAFALPMIARLKEREIGLVLAPTRELAMQIAETYKKLDIECVLIIGGAPMNQQSHKLRGRYSVIVATPGRLTDHLQQGTTRLDRVKILVLDEADRMLDMGFAPAIKRILDVTPTDRQTLLFSATMPKEIRELANNYMVDPQQVEITPTGSTPELVDQELIYVQHEDKHPMLRELLYENKGSVLVFSRTRHGARKLAKAIRFDGHSAAELHADRTLAQRKAALEGFKKGEYRILVATDIAARGIDVKDISLVINYDVPENAHDYVHRIGRTGRAGASGQAITLAIPAQARDIRDIEKLLGTPLTLSARSTSLEHVARSRQAGARVPSRPAQPVMAEAPVAPAVQVEETPRPEASNGGSQYGRMNGGYARRDERAPNRNEQSRGSYPRRDDRAPSRNDQPDQRDQRPNNQNDSPNRGYQRRDDRGPSRNDQPNAGYQRRDEGGYGQRDQRPQNPNGRPNNGYPRRDERASFGNDRPNGGYSPRNDQGPSRNDGFNRNQDRPNQERPFQDRNGSGQRGGFGRPQNGRNTNPNGNGRFQKFSNENKPPQRDDRPTSGGQSRPWRNKPEQPTPNNSADAPKPFSNDRPGNNPGHPSAQGKKGHRGWSGKPKFKSKPKFGR